MEEEGGTRKYVGPGYVELYCSSRKQFLVELPPLALPTCPVHGPEAQL